MEDDEMTSSEEINLRLQAIQQQSSKRAKKIAEKSDDKMRHICKLPIVVLSSIEPQYYSILGAVIGSIELT